MAATSLWTTGASDTVQMGSGVLVADVVLSSSGNQLQLSISGTTDQLSLGQYFQPDSEAYSGSIEQIRFADGTVWDSAAIMGRVPASTLASADNDVLFGVSGVANSLAGLDGDDWLQGRSLNDTLDGGGGQDSLYAAAGNDLVSGGAENDALYGGDGDDIVNGGSGDDFLDGGKGNDTLDGGFGNDSLMGAQGSKTFLFGRGSGRDSIVGFSDTPTSNTVVLGSGVVAGDVVLNRDGLRIKGTSDVLLFSTGIGQITFADGTVWDATTITALRQAGSDDSDSLSGDIAGPTGDYLIGQIGDDTIAGGEGRDTIDGGAGFDSLKGGNDNDLIFGGAQDDYLFGDAGNDTLQGGAGSDVLLGSYGSDVYVYELGDGFDTIEDDRSASQAGYVDTLRLGAGILTSSISFSNGWLISNGGGYYLNPDYLTISGIGVGGFIAVHDFFGVAESYPYCQLQEIQFDSGAVWDKPLITAMVGSVISTGSSASDSLTGSTSPNRMTGLEGNDVLTGGGSSDWLDGGTGSDTLIGGAGNDTYQIDSLSDVVQEAAGGGTDTLESSITVTLGAELENLRLIGPYWINGTGNAGNNVLTGNDGGNVLDGGAGADTMSGRGGDDVYVVDSSSDKIIEVIGSGYDTVLSSVSWALGDPYSFSEVEALTLTGTAAINATGNSLANVLVGNGAANRLDGGSSADTMSGGAGDDTYVVSDAGDVVIEDVDGGVDTVEAQTSYALTANVENLKLSSPPYSYGYGAINGTGNALANSLVGNDYFGNRLDGGAGADTMAGGAGDDTYVVDNIGDVIVETASNGKDTVESSITWTLTTEVENLTLTGTSNINATGNTAANTLRGNTGDNILTGGAGNDSMLGGAGNDTYLVDVTTDVLTENANEGIDTVQSAIAWTLATNFENLVLTGSNAVDGTGNSAANTLTGNSGANRLNGGTGADSMLGGAGNDTYVVDNAGDVITELAGAGTDAVESSITWTLGAELEKLTLTGSAAINATGNTIGNTLIGNSGANRLDGGAGADSMTGGAGNDTFVVDNTGDVTTEASGGGTDTVESSITWSLAIDVENLTLTGTAAINATGNTTANTLRGNAGNNVLTGGAGNDSMLGGAGNDTYVVDVSTDVITENANEGVDTVQSAVTWTLGSNLEYLALTGTAAINGTGNTLDNLLTGNSANNTLTGGSGNDTLDGGLGNDTMLGGTGNDTYAVNVATDVITENANEGIDAVQSAVTYTLSANLENLTLTGTAAINGTGNANANTLIGNTGVNTLAGAEGNDIYDGGAGNDVFSDTSTSSSDTYRWGIGVGSDTLSDAGGTLDHVDLFAGITKAQLKFVKNVNNLELSVIGQADKLVINNWYTSSANQIEEFRLSDGSKVLASEVAGLLSAMAVFDAPASLAASGRMRALPAGRCMHFAPSSAATSGHMRAMPVWKFNDLAASSL
jgi:trimeric autotransporter adhesin